MLVSRKIGSLREVFANGNRLEFALECKYLGCVVNEYGTDGAECRRKVASRMKVACAMISLVNNRNLQLECTRALYEALLVPDNMEVERVV